MNDDEIKENKNSGNYIKIINNTPDVILDNVNDAENIPLIIRFDALYLALNKDGLLKGHYHNLGSDVIKQLPKLIDDPDAIVRLDNNRLNLYSYISGNNNIISIELNTIKDINKSNNKYNLVVTAFSPKSNYVKNLIRNYGIKIEYEKKNLKQVNPQLYEWLSTINNKFFNNNISQSETVVNNYSMQNVNTSSEKQVKYSVNVDTDVKELRRENIRAKFLSALDTASENYKSGQKNSTAAGSTNNSLNVEFDDNTDFTKNINKVANMKSVCDLTGSEFEKSDIDLITQVTEYFNKIGNKVESKYGSVVINKKGVKSSVSHGLGRNKAIAFKAVPSVIESGEIIDYKSNYKNRGYETAVFAAPITISQTSYFAAVVVTINKKSNKYYLHEVALQKKEDAVPFKTGTVNNGTPSDTTSPIYSLINSLQNVKTSSEKQAKFSLDVDEFDEEDYNYPKLDQREYKHLYSEILTNFSNVKNLINCIHLASSNSTYLYVLDDDYNIIVYDKRKIINIHERSNYDTVDGFTTRFDTGLKSVGSKRRTNKSHNIRSGNRNLARGNVQVFDRTIQSERRGDRTGYNEGSNNADLRKENGKESLDVDTDVKELRQRISARNFFPLLIQLLKTIKKVMI